MRQTERAYREFIQKRREEGLLRGFYAFSPVDSRHIAVAGTDYLNFSSNDYLGLRFNPALTERAKDWAGRYGAGSGASRLVTGNLDIFTTIETKLAAFKGKEAALVMVSGFQANASVLPALFDRQVLGAEPLVFTDKLNHASMHLGCAAANVKQIRYRHNDMAHLESLLDEQKDSDQPKFILTESVFSMDGDIADLKTLSALAKKHDAFLIVDEAHATGVLGNRGKGLALDADLVIGTFSKAMGSFGAYVACSQDIKEFLINKCAGLIYATALPPAVLGSIDAAIDLVPAMDKERAHVQKLAATFRDEMKLLGYDTGDSQTQIVPVIIGGAEDSLRLSEKLKEAKLWATTIRPPTVPKDTARIRFAFSAAHTESDIEKLLGAFKSYGTAKAA
jgi:8-amino-7-oxononanoate synthase